LSHRAPLFRLRPTSKSGSNVRGRIAPTPRIFALCASCLVLGLVLCPAASAQAQGSAGSTGETKPPREWTFEVGLGAEYDTNVTVDEVDLSSGQSDYAWIADLGIGVKQDLGDDTRFNLKYDISQSSYQEFSRVDRLTQILGADLSHDLGKANAGFSAYFIDSRLDGEGFLRYLRLSPSLSGFLGKRWFARGAYVFSERRIDERSNRDAETKSGEADLYYFHRGLRSYLNFGYRYRREDAIAPEFDFDAHSFKLRYIRRLDVKGSRWKAEVALRYEIRDYQSEEPTIGEKRADDRLQLKLDLEVPLSSRVTLQAYSSYGDYTSNLPRADFLQTIVGTRLEYKW
jgi:hypothetical protein